jgi:nitrogen fixation NifU-like protein
LSLTDDLYRDIILEHFRNPRNQGKLDQPTFISHGTNPFCGDELELTVALEEDVIREIRVQPKGCSISQASASMMTEAIQGKTVPQAKEMARRFKAAMLEGASLETAPDMEDLQALEGVKKYPVRIKCAILGWNTLLEGLSAHHKGKKEATHVEGEEGEHKPLAAEPEQPAAAQAAVSTGSPEEQVREALRTVIDPELNLNILDLGLIYGTEIQGGNVKVTYTLTSPGCPLGPVIKGQMQSALLRLGWVKEIQADLAWIPPWDPKTMASEEIKTELGIW